MSSPLDTNTTSSTPPTTSSPVSSVVSDGDGQGQANSAPMKDKFNPLDDPYYPYFTHFKNSKWYDHPMRTSRDAPHAVVQMTTVDRPYSSYPELLRLKDGKYNVPQIFKFELQNTTPSAQYMLGIRFNTSMRLFKRPDRYVSAHDFGFSSVEVKKGPYTGEQLQTGVVHFNDIKLERCEAAEPDPKLIILEPLRVWFPIFSVYELRGNEEVFIVEFQVPEMGVTAIDEEEHEKQCDICLSVTSPFPNDDNHLQPSLSAPGEEATVVFLSCPFCKPINQPSSSSLITESTNP